MKYIIDIPDNAGWIEYYAPVEGVSNYFKGTSIGVDQMTPYIKSGRKSIEDEVWEFAKMMATGKGINTIDNITECFGENVHFSLDILNMTYQEAKVKYEKWKKQKAEIRVGDEVIYHRDKYIVGYIEEDEVYYLVDQCWIRVIVEGNYELTKTGRHFDEVEELLKKMKEG